MTTLGDIDDLERDSTPNQQALAVTKTRANFAEHDFVIGDANRAAFDVAINWITNKNAPALIIEGAPKSGKTHLAHIVAARFDAHLPHAQNNASAAHFINVMNSNADLPQSTPGGAQLYVYDGFDGDTPTRLEPRYLMALLNDQVVHGHKVILIGVNGPKLWAQGLVDLETRLEAMARVSLYEPDEPILEAVLQKLFRDRQVRVHPNVIKFAAPRLPRTYCAASSFVEVCDQLALEKNSKISVAIAQNALETLSLA